MVAVACHGADMPVAERLKMQTLSPHVLQLLGTADMTLQVERGCELPQMINRALTRGYVECLKVPVEDQTTADCERRLSTQDALSAVGSNLQPQNWVLLEPTKLEVHGVGSGGLDELTESLPLDRVMFGVLRFSFPRDHICHDAPPIVKYMFVHWIGPKVSPLRRGRWNSKVEEAVSSIRKFCDFAFRKTIYGVEDLELSQLIEELARVTCVTSSDTRQLSAAWYLEGLIAELAMQCQDGIESSQAGRADSDELQPMPKPLLRDSTKHAVDKVREEGCKWKWVLLNVTEGTAPSSGGA